jgi:hypothetical protein
MAIFPSYGFPCTRTIRSWTFFACIVIGGPGQGLDFGAEKSRAGELSLQWLSYGPTPLSSRHTTAGRTSPGHGGVDRHPVPRQGGRGRALARAGAGVVGNAAGVAGGMGWRWPQAMQTWSADSCANSGGSVSRRPLQRGQRGRSRRITSGSVWSDAGQVVDGEMAWGGGWRILFPSRACAGLRHARRRMFAASPSRAGRGLGRGGRDDAQGNDGGWGVLPILRRTRREVGATLRQTALTELHRDAPCRAEPGDGARWRGTASYARQPRPSAPAAGGCGRRRWSGRGITGACGRRHHRLGATYLGGARLQSGGKPFIRAPQPGARP